MNEIGWVIAVVEAVVIVAYKLHQRQEDKVMVSLYCALIIAGRRKFSQVPAKFQDAVKADLLAIGLDENGNPIEE